ncbi:ABC transporter ATP-binding protein [Haloimpatiens lingqiaonensis]|uniref:ABC transporter ATP-binding protein n=1 Tax=Haloimpatiens lingqiaonensis TaxID=1380675 RepID=UPI0010FE57CF|nr:ABC transporter ATP-binding protein [Haloimpatiens lingqiaonensis]
MEKIIKVTNLKKSYGQVRAVKGIDFYVEKGKLFAFLGPNGAGKSTTIDMICTFLKPDEGEIIIDGFKIGKDDDEIRSIIGAVFQDGLLDNLLTVKENLEIRGSFYGIKKDKLQEAVKRVIRTVGLEEFAKRPYGKLSGGQKRRADIARALINTPKILFLDEPTTGLDPQTRKNVWEIILKLQKENNTTVFLTTHYMEEAAGADYVMVIDDGLIVAKGTPTELREKYSSDTLMLSYIDEARVCHILEDASIKYEKKGDRIVAKIPSTMDALPIIEQCKEYITAFEVHAGTMDDAFIGITGKEMRE